MIEGEHLILEEHDSPFVGIDRLNEDGDQQYEPAFGWGEYEPSEWYLRGVKTTRED